MKSIEHGIFQGPLNLRALPHEARNEKIRLIATAILLCISVTVLAAEQMKYRLLLQVSEDSVDKLNMALDNARSALKEFGPESVDVEIVVYGSGVQTLKYYAPIPIADKVREVTTEGVRIVVSENSMRRAKLRPSDMLEQVRYVPSGIVELVEKQTLGWSYVRP